MEILDFLNRLEIRIYCYKLQYGFNWQTDQSRNRMNILALESSI